MFARTSSWRGSPEALGRWAEQAATKVRPFVQGLEGNLAAYFLIDRDGGRALTVTIWESEEAALASDEAAERSRARTIEASGIELVDRGRYELVASL